MISLHEDPHFTFRFADDGAMPFTLVGLLTSFTRPVAAAGMDVFAVSTFDTDYLFFQDTQFQTAVAALKRDVHSVEGVLP